jgi:quinoprotein glucose dehydrogenase
MLYIPSIQGAIVVKLVKPDASRSNFNYVRGAGGNPAFPTGLPLFKPPYGRVTAINLNTGDHTWMTPNGDGPRKQVNDALKAATGKDIDVGALGAGGSGPLLTKTLLFIAQGAAGRGGSAGGGASWMRAFDKATGKIVAEIPLPAVPNSTPMTYSINGKQYIVVSTSDNKLVALSLP